MKAEPGWARPNSCTLQQSSDRNKIHSDFLIVISHECKAVAFFLSKDCRITIVKKRALPSRACFSDRRISFSQTWMNFTDVKSRIESCLQCLPDLHVDYTQHKNANWQAETVSIASQSSGWAVQKKVWPLQQETYAVSATHLTCVTELEAWFFFPFSV